MGVTRETPFSWQKMNSIFELENFSNLDFEFAYS